MGYGDLFVAGLLGALLAGDVRLQRHGALLTLAVAAVFDLLFLAVNELPATVPVALTLIVIEVWERFGRRRFTQRARGTSRTGKTATEPVGPP
jgi:hypothetical protein